MNKTILMILIFFLFLVLYFVSCEESSSDDWMTDVDGGGVIKSIPWSEWWSYDGGITRPKLWGTVNTDWELCIKGKRQSPIDINPRLLLFDPSLKALQIRGGKVNGYLKNFGNMLKFIWEKKNPKIGEEEEEEDEEKEKLRRVNITGGPLSYNFIFFEIMFHFGEHSICGSEHAVDGNAFPAEIQLMGFNKDLYHNISHARSSPNGLVAVAILCQINEQNANKEFRKMTQKMDQIKTKGEQVNISNLDLQKLLPETEEFITYEGSLTYPACQETVTWVIFNKPMYISQQDLFLLRGLGEEPTKLQNNFRPISDLHNRSIRTNINFHNQSSGCTMEKKLNYQTLLKKSLNRR